MIQFDNWEIIKEIKNNNHNNIFFRVNPIIKPDLSEDEQKELTSKKWILKYAIDYKIEVLLIEQNKIYQNKLCVPMPQIASYRKKYLEKDSWYVMEKCDGSLFDFILTAKSNLNELMVYMIDVFDWLHCKEGKVHGDIKLENILIKNSISKNNFYIIDYETITKPKDYICKEDLPNGYYYYYIGCLPDKPYYSFRMDLEAFGMILVQIYLSETSPLHFKWQNKANKYYTKKITENFFDKLDKEKFYEMSDEMKKVDNKMILQYLEIIKQQDWDAKFPNLAVYNQLKQIFNLS